jgi:hypothetical protein
MIGQKKLNIVRQELRRALSGIGDDSIRWLEERMAGKVQGPAASGESEVLQSLRRILQPTGAGKKPGQGTGAKK